MAEDDRGDESAILDLDPVKDLQAFPQAPQYRDGILDRRLVHDDRLKSALECRVLLHVLAVLSERCCTDHVQLTTGKHWLEHVAGVHGPIGGAGSDHSVQLVDEEQDPAFGCDDFREHRLESLLELAAVLRTGDQCPHVEGKDHLVPQPLRHVSPGDPLSKPLDYRGLADPRVADQHRIVLGLARQDLHDTADLGVAPDDRVQTTVCRILYEIPAILRQRFVSDLRHRGGHSLITPDRGQRLQERVPGQALLPQQPTRGRP